VVALRAVQAATAHQVKALLPEIKALEAKPPKASGLWNEFLSDAVKEALQALGGQRGDVARAKPARAWYVR